MACVNGYIKRIDNISGSLIRMDIVRGEIERIEKVSAILSQICDSDIGDFIRFDPKYLSWDASEIGVVKYSNLIVSGPWELEEVLIEELL